MLSSDSSAYLRLAHFAQWLFEGRNNHAHVRESLNPLKLLAILSLVSTGASAYNPSGIVNRFAASAPGSDFIRRRGLPLAESRYRSPLVKPAWYKTRQKPITKAQKRIERALWPQWGLVYSYNQTIDLGVAFGRDAPTVFEIGYGDGEALVESAAARPEWNFVGVEWSRACVAKSLASIEERNLTNVRVVRSNVALLLDRGLPMEPLFDEVKIFFPDPWHSSPEHKVVRPDIIRQISHRMRPSGFLHVATDVEGYPAQVREVLASPEAAGGHWTAVDRLSVRPLTRYAREAVAEGRPIEDLHFVFEGLSDAA